MEIHILMIFINALITQMKINNQIVHIVGRIKMDQLCLFIYECSLQLWA